VVRHRHGQARACHGSDTSSQRHDDDCRLGLQDDDDHQAEVDAGHPHHSTADANHAAHAAHHATDSPDAADADHDSNDVSAAAADHHPHNVTWRRGWRRGRLLSYTDVHDTRRPAGWSK
jgi:hypothetical protein